MPLYDYKCPECEIRFEVSHGMSEDAPPCPECGHETPQRVITAAPKYAKGMNAHPGDGRRASKEQLREETPKLRKKMVDKFGEDYVNRNAPSLNYKYDRDA